jgi:hypothetical protein
MDLTMSKTERHASASSQLLIVMTERKAAPIDSRRFQPDLARVLRREARLGSQDHRLEARIVAKPSEIRIDLDVA